MIEGDDEGCQVLTIQRDPTCLAFLQNPTAIEERQHVPSPQNIPWHFPSY